MGNTLKKNELVAGFISFLLQLLYPHPFSFAPYVIPDVENRVVEELRFLDKILGDTPFQATEFEQVQNLILEEFEQVANQAGTLVYYIVFTPDAEVKTTNDALGVFLEHIELLKANINIFLDFLPNTAATLTSNAGLDSLVILDSLLYDLEDLMNRGDNLLVGVKDLIKKLHEWLMLFHSLFNSQQLTENELRKEPLVQVIAVAYDAQSLIHSFLAGDVPLWYFSIRLTRHINSIQLNATGLQKMIAEYDIGAPKLADDFTAQKAQQKEGSKVDEIIDGFDQHKENMLDLIVRGTTKLHKI